MNVQLVIMEGEKNDFEAQISQLESRETATNQQIEELKTQVEELVEQKESLRKQLELDDKKKKDITPFCDQECKIQEHIHHFQVILIGKIFKVRLMMERLKVIVAESLAFRKGLFKVAKNVKIQMTWRDINSNFHDHLT